MSKLSIITVNLNNAAGLRKTIESVRAQTFKDFEHIIIDGGSTDKSVGVIKEFEDGFAYWVSEPDGGIYQGMNKGTKVAKGEYCLYLNSGDYLYNSKVLEKVFKEKLSEDLVLGNNFRENVKGQRKLFKPLPVNRINIISLLNRFIFNHNSAFIKKEFIVKQNYYRTDFKHISDIVIFYNAFLLYNATIKYIPITISVFQLDGTSFLYSKISTKELNIFNEELFGNNTIVKKIKELRYLEEISNLPFVKTYCKIIYLLKNNIKKMKRFLGIDFELNSKKYLFEQHNRPYYINKLSFKNINFPKEKKIFLWGNGKYIKDILDICNKNKWQVEAILDSNKNLHGTHILGKPVLPPSSVIGNDNIILICTYIYAEQISNECKKVGLIQGKDFFVPFKSA